MRYFLFIICVLNISCSASKDESKVELSDLENAIFIVPLLSSMPDEISSNYNFEGGQNNMGPQDSASPSCNRSFTACSDGKKTHSETCSYIYGSVIRNISHDFYNSQGQKNSQCSYDSGDVISKEFDILAQSGINKKLYKSEDHADFLGTVHGGGIRLIKKDSSFDLEISGIFALKLVNDSLEKDISFFSTKNISLNKTERSNRMFSGGEIIIRDNLKKKEGKLNIQFLEYSVTCCHPYRGQINLNVEGESTDFIFEGCGKVRAISGSQERTFNLELCQ